jgi:hypothetical protein
MNARASQPELPKSAVTLSSGAEGFASRSAEVAESVGAKQAHIVVAPSMGGQRHHDAAPQCYGEERLTQREFSLFRSAAVDSQPGSLIKSAAGGSQPESLIKSGGSLVFCGNAFLCDNGCKKAGAPVLGGNGLPCATPGVANPCITNTQICLAGCACIQRGNNPLSAVCLYDN